MRTAFQSATVRWATERLIDPRGTGRVLVADEVGLGKTFVAQGVIDELSQRHKGPDPFRVFYVCSSLSIATQNEERIRDVLPKGERESARVEGTSRLSMMLEAEIPSPAARFLLYTLTPNTSFRQGTGLADERLKLARCVWAQFGYTALDWFHDAFQVGVGSIRWRHLWDDMAIPSWFTVALSKRFESNVRVGFPRGTTFGTDALAERVKRALQDGARCREAVASLRAALILTVVDQLRPDLIVFDEFQRFFEVLPVDAEPDEAAREHDDDNEQAREVVAALLRQSACVGERARVLMLSATPYRMYARAQETQQHHEEFYALVRFLFAERGVETTQVLRAEFARYRELLERELVGSPAVLRVKRTIEKLLGTVMARTERAGLLGGRHSPSNIEACPVKLGPDEVKVFRHLIESCGGRHRGAAEAFWSSVPLPLQMMRAKDYAFRRAAEPARVPRDGSVPSLGTASLRSYRAFENRSYPHARLRGLLHVLPAEILELPWLPPSLPWWPLEAPFLPPEAHGRWSKALVFSRFRAVPRSLATLLSYEAERGAIEPSMRRRGRRRFDWSSRGTHEVRAGEPRNRPPTLRPLPSPSFATAHGRGWCTPIVMFLPWPTLANVVDPLALAVRCRGKLTRDAALAAARSRLVALLGRDPDRRTHVPVWKWIVRLERRLGGDDGRDLERALCKWRELGASSALFELTDDEASNPTDGELDELADIAVSGPGPMLWRVVRRVFGPGGESIEERDERMVAVLAAANALRGYLDVPEWHVSFVEHLGRAGRLAEGVRMAAWRGNLEAVLDEFLATEQGMGTTRPNTEREAASLKSLRNVLALRETRLEVERVGGVGRPLRLRCHAAVAYGLGSSGEEPDAPRADQVRAAFNSPFRPMVLITTSVGQEGLDFHRWSRHLIHWDLPGNPVDLEQRDGRLRRHGGLAVRSALGERVQVHEIDPERSPWHVVSERHPPSPEGLGLEPWWHCDGATVRRTLILTSFSDQRERCRRLQNELDLYRLAMGQPDQEELLARLEQRLIGADPETRQEVRVWLRSATIDLRPR